MLSGIALLAGLACIPHAVSTPTGVEAQVPLQPVAQKQQTGEASMLLEFLDAVKAQNDDLSINGGAITTPLYSGIATFAHLDNVNCFSNKTDGKFDIGVVGMPFDLGVTYRPGARFGPGAARMASRRLSPFVYE
ncbi:hypothetical protein KEM56_002461 [Ascosphaera pollenicola]|nr:hypothetical protein KEM56_002461 [Ascosphaera pollenicola]